ncbi:unnamed protein product [Periconia digitata]|uniref:Uncharacterized protein n=1 Tax=Periconia digitata TaxID=1303443 RepID=A0A9W4ULB7_9PLEO|nr:unnamed protein product [Periconia digitata]
MQFFVILAIATTVSAATCGINGSLCDSKKRSVGMTNQVREWIHERSAPAVPVVEVTPDTISIE